MVWPTNIRIYPDFCSFLLLILSFFAWCTGMRTYLTMMKTRAGIRGSRIKSYPPFDWMRTWIAQSLCQLCYWRWYCLYTRFRLYRTERGLVASVNTCHERDMLEEATILAVKLTEGMLTSILALASSNMRVLNDTESDAQCLYFHLAAATIFPKSLKGRKPS